MSINLYNIKKWYKMVTGNSILHVNQGIGQVYSKTNISGYYNDLTEKIIKSDVEEFGLPLTEMPDGKKISFPIAIFQYGLGAYDLYILTEKKEYLNRFMTAVEWTYSKQLDNGGWKTFFENSNPFSSMAQGEGASLLIRAYCKTGDLKYFESAKKAIYFMIKSVENGGATIYEKNNVYLKEFCNSPVVLNGWIFSIFGLYDYLLINKNDKKIKKIYNNTIQTLNDNLYKYDIGYWSKYDIDKKIASPFYHKLHSSLLYVLHDLTNNSLFFDYAQKFKKYQENRIYKIKAFIIKAYQKVKEK